MLSNPKLIYGTAWKKQQTTQWVQLAWQCGFRAFDTACQPKHYREDLVGQALAQIMADGFKREDFYLQTKFTPVKGQDLDSIPYDANATIEQQVLQSFTVSKTNLHTNYLDALILHSPLPTFEQTLQAWRALESVYNLGGAKALGISNCYDLELLSKLYDQVQIKPTVVQNRFYRQTHYDKTLRHFCLEHNIQYQSFWTLTANPHLLESEEIFSFARSLKKTPAQILFCYLSQRGITPLTGTCDSEHMQQDLAISTFELTEDQLQKIDNLL